MDSGMMCISGLIEQLILGSVLGAAYFLVYNAHMYIGKAIKRTVPALSVPSLLIYPDKIFNDMDNKKSKIEIKNQNN